MTTDKEIDERLVKQAQGGELSAFEELVARHERKVYSLALRMLRSQHDAEDVTQQSFLSAMEHLGQFRGEASFATWILRIATHAALKVVRKRKGLETVPLEEVSESTESVGSAPRPRFVAHWQESPVRLVERRETRQILEDALDQLEEKYRVVFLLRDIEGLSVKETARALDLSEANVKVRLLRARLQLREVLTRRFGDPTRQLAMDQPHGHS